jgi:hypothetical protein
MTGGPRQSTRRGHKSSRTTSVTGPLVQSGAITSQVPTVASESPAIVADNVKVAGDVVPTAVSHIAVEFVPIPMQPSVIVMKVGMNVVAIAFIPRSRSCGRG